MLKKHLYSEKIFWFIIQFLGFILNFRLYENFSFSESMGWESRFSPVEERVWCIVLLETISFNSAFFPKNHHFFWLYEIYIAVKWYAS